MSAGNNSAWMIVILGLLLNACNSSSEADAAVAEIVDSAHLNLAYGIKQFQFSWQAVTNAEYYQLFENPDGASGYRLVADSITDLSYQLDVPLYNRVNASYLLQACNSKNCTRSRTIFVSSTLIEATGYFKADDVRLDDMFGRSVALSEDGQTLAVGANSDDKTMTADEAQDLVGVYIFSHGNEGWSQQGFVTASNADEGDYFGQSIALSDDGNTLAVGAKTEDGSATEINGPNDNNSQNSGAVYVYVRSRDSWTEQAYVKADDTDNGKWFGESVALSESGDTLAVGSRYGGACYIFVRYDDEWSQQAKIAIDGYAFGYPVALSDDGNTLAVADSADNSDATGVDESSTGEATLSGAVYVYTREDGLWSEPTYIKASNTDISDWFGTALSLSGDGLTLVVAAPGEDSAATAINGDEADNSLSWVGAAYVFFKADGEWSQQAYIKASNTDDSDNFGSSVSVSDDGNTLAIGAQSEDSASAGINGAENDNSVSQAGAVYLYSRSDGSWTQQAYIKASNPNTALFGYSTSLSGDGHSLAVGAAGEDSDLSGIAVGIESGDDNEEAADSGAVYLY